MVISDVHRAMIWGVSLLYFGINLVPRHGGLGPQLVPSELRTKHVPSHAPMQEYTQRQ